ncbi:GNAT family N-acetyltransferase [Candidatus Pelagibacter sp.]|nr:GNAT family N-acetyltransferase [Candidatus Pelagibacter sp.]
MITKVDRNYLEINSPGEIKVSNKPNKDCKIEIKNPPDFQINKFFYKQIGKSYRWIDRLVWDDSTWMNYTNNSNLETYILSENGDLIGFFELLFHTGTRKCEVAYIGILHEYIGKNYGKYLLAEALKLGFRKNTKKVWLHTCSLDHKHALKNYLSRGMQIFKSETIDVDIN